MNNQKKNSAPAHSASTAASAGNDIGDFIIRCHKIVQLTEREIAAIKYAVEELGCIELITMQNSSFWSRYRGIGKASLVKFEKLKITSKLRDKIHRKERIHKVTKIQP